MKLVLLNGSSCSGKSTIIKNIMKEKEYLFQLSYDSFKWLFAKYKSDKHYEDVQKVVLAVAEAVFKMKYDVISDSQLYRESRQKLVDLAKKYEYEIIEINLEADYEILAKRFDERVESASRDSERKISNLSKDRFKEINNIFQNEKNPSAIVFRTDTQSVEQISKDIMNLL